MAHGSRKDLHLMAALMMASDSPLSNILTPEEADEQERLGFRVARIPIKPRESLDEKRGA